jgi:hypothetical protein
MLALYLRLAFFIMLTFFVCQGNPFWKLVRNLLKTPDQEQIACQQPKPILLDTGEMKLPYDWAVSYSFMLNLCLLVSRLSSVMVNGIETSFN